MLLPPRGDMVTVELVDGHSSRCCDEELKEFWSDLSDTSEPLDCNPVAMLNPGEFLVQDKDSFCNNLLLLEGGDRELEISEWVLLRSKKLSKVVGVTYGEFEEDFIKLLSAIEKKGRVVGAVTPKKNLVPVDRRRKELKKLEFTINYDDREGQKELFGGAKKGHILAIIPL